jgi:nuclear pore complex protein Nup155
MKAIVHKNLTINFVLFNSLFFFGLEMMIDNISHVLVIATPLEVILLGVSAGRENALPGNTLYTTYLSVPSDNVSMTSIHGSSTGRIFMTGSDGHVYEMEYQVCAKEA